MSKFDWNRHAWNNWKDWYFRKYGREFQGEPCLTLDELKTEWGIMIVEGKERSSRERWAGQDSADHQYNGIFNLDTLIIF